MLKSADTLAGAGHDVRVVATLHEPWAVATDADVRSHRPWPVTVVDYRPSAGVTYWRSGARHRTARAVASALGPERAPFAVVASAFGRVHAELVRAATAQPADLFYGGTTGALAAVAEAARRQGVPYGLDFEDLHSSESDEGNAALDHALAARIEAGVLRGAAFATTSSEAIAQAYRDLYGVTPVVVHNTFSLPFQPPSFARDDSAALRLYWFSQTIGPGRGLEETIAACGCAAITAQLSLRGRAEPGYIEALCALARSQAPGLEVIHLPYAPPDAMVDLARPHDVGLAVELMNVRNRQLCLTNKAFTYILAGLAVAMSDTPGQHALGVDLGDGAALVTPGDPRSLAAALTRWAADRGALDAAKRAAWDAARRRWHWEHREERGRLCELVRHAVA